MMATIHSPKAPLSRERGPAEKPHAVTRGSTHENLGLPGAPSAFESMLRTTTETGDIGLFSIKPPRVSQPPPGPRKISKSYRDLGKHQPRQPLPNGAPNRDDRFRLTSYAGDASSEIISMSETDSQKSSSQGFNNPYFRSYSMTQAYVPSPLPNRYSYASLRSQTGGDGPSQRPRSPFAYPTRLKRPGFRPCSPALTDGGGIGYRRRAEADRLPYGSHYGTSSPSSLYTRNHTAPALSLRQNSNRSSPSLLLGQSSPQRRSPSPRMRHSSGPAVSYWQHRNGSFPASMSPARSTLSLESTADLHETTPAHSPSITPAKAPSPSTLFYDYTEDFGGNDSTQPDLLEPPPPFQLENTIPEDQPLTADCLSTEPRSRYPTEQGSGHAFATPSTPTWDLPSPPEGTQYLKARAGRLQSDQELHTRTTASRDSNLADRAAERTIGKNVTRLSGLDSRAQIPSAHAAEPFVHLQSPAIGIIDCIRSTNADTNKQDICASNCNGSTPTLEHNNTETQFAKASTCTCSSLHSSDIVDPECANRGVDIENKQISRSGRVHNAIGAGTSSQTCQKHTPSLNGGLSPPSSDQEISEAGSRLPPMSSTKAHWMGPKLTSSASEGLTVVTGAGLRATFHDADTSQNLGARDLMYDVSHNPSQENASNYTHQVRQNGMSPSEYLMSGPSPVSHIRQPEFDNSVPETMKTSPSLPSDLDLPSSVSPPMSEDRSVPNQELERSVRPDQDTPTYAPVLDSTLSQNSHEHHKEEKVPQTPVSAKFKLKLQAPVPVHPNSPRFSSPWDSEENYPWSNQNSDVDLPAGNDYDNPKPPRFRLKVTRASDSILSTVRVNRGSADSNPLAALHLRDPRDLFTPSSGIDNLFRQVNNHTPGASSTSAHSPIEGEHASILASISDQLFDNRPSSLELNILQPSTLPGSPISPSDVQSFFSDDSSHVYGKRSLRKRLSNLRARVAVPYSSKNGANGYDGANSYDDINLRNAQQGTVSATWSTDNLAARAGTQGSRIRRLTDRMHARKLRERVSGWIKGAKSVIVARMKPGSASVVDYDQDSPHMTTPAG